MENTGGKRTILELTARTALNSPSAIPFENKKKILDQPQTENGFLGNSGGDEVRHLSFQYIPQIVILAQYNKGLHIVIVLARS